jgi:hypothetical protein
MPPPAPKAVPMRAINLVIGLGLLLISAPGCDGAKLYPVEGAIVYPDGEAVTGLAGASVEFDPIAGKEGARGEVQPDGTFRLGTHKPGDGAAPGEYRVCIQPPLPALDRPAPRVLDRRYENVATSGLRVTIKAETNHVRLEVEKPKPGH